MSEEQTLNEVYADTLKKMENLTEKQKKVLQASLELFASQGFEATTSQQIAKKGGSFCWFCLPHFPHETSHSCSGTCTYL
ncbi:TetR family transcriptional regulator [Lactococcus lactis]|nr:TetR family transcriptional regulator [Lactococcus lactis]